MSRTTDDSQMSRYDEHGLRRYRARDAVLAVALVSLVLVVVEGAGIRHAGEQMGSGVDGDVVRTIGAPAGWIADRLPLGDLVHGATAWLSPDEQLVAGAGFDNQAGGGDVVAARGVPPVTADAFDSAVLGAKAPPRRPLRRLLVTGDSLSTPLDIELARKLAGRGVQVVREPHLGTAISKSFLVDWASLAATQVKRVRPDAVVIFIGANEGFPLETAKGQPKVACCDAHWAAAYASRVRRMAGTYRRDGAARVYWITVPTPRDPDRQRIGRVVNAAINVAVEPWRAQVRVIDTVPTFTPGGYRDAMQISGRSTIVRRPDGIHLNNAGSSLLADVVLGRIGSDFTFPRAG
jgi:lysophospholipase L1-like esterase